jgi:hypothetical protein
VAKTYREGQSACPVRGISTKAWAPRLEDPTKQAVKTRASPRRGYDGLPDSRTNARLFMVSFGLVLPRG